MNYINGKSETQNFYADKLGTTSDGTDMTKIPDVLNKYQSRCKYVYKEFSDLSTWKSRVKTDTKNQAQITGVIVQVVIFYVNDTDYVFICDPHPSYGGVYKVSAKKAYTVNEAHFCSAMIW